ncbi:MAG TPA: lysophospholipid acyltransferase family protein [Burkholderiales bacterium]|jgi:KDO2-lipid IV(A) lauroyltransferase|nr:lysophospholipid acyltransferase family protein [Burkholderiales bacterium]
MLTGLLRLLGRLPLSFLHAAGAALGWLVYLSSHNYASRLRENLLQSGLWADERDYERLLRANIAESGRAAAEVAAIWFRPQQETASWVRAVHGWEAVERAHRDGRGLVLLTPHLGCFEVIAQYLALRFPLTVLYRPPRYRLLEAAMREGRSRPQLHAASTDLGGVRALLKALKRGEAVGILPDQVPGAGEGEWAEFFGRPAYTMTLASKLAQRTGAASFLTHARRLPRGAGYELAFEPLPARQPGESAARHLNRALENLIRRYPEQYLWSYNRYKGQA